MRFSKATAVTPANDRPGVFAAEIPLGWDILDNANGGYLLALGARAMNQAAGRAHPVSVTAHFLAPAKAGPVTIETELVKTGRSFSTVRATITADRPIVTLVGAFGDVSSVEGPELITAQPPEMPDPDDCTTIRPGDPFPPAILGNVDIRVHPEDAGAYRNQGSGSARIRGWFRLCDDEPFDAFALLLATDVFAPTTFNATLPVGWTPTIELTAHVRGIPSGAWLRCSFSTRYITGGFMEEDGEIWTEDGRMVAMSRQLALVARP